MEQSNTLSRQPDHCPDEDHDNKDVVMLEENLFLNLLDFDVAEVLEALLGNGPTTLWHDLED